ncbi:MAG: AAA family ATPase [Nitrospiraceae bacterium]|nr:AAA family ATPase [Nitrospiraceae bacterium]
MPHAGRRVGWPRPRGCARGVRIRPRASGRGVPDATSGPDCPRGQTGGGPVGRSLPRRSFRRHGRGVRGSRFRGYARNLAGGPRRFIQVLAGPRQTGKTTLARQLIEAVNMPAHYATADEPTLKGGMWLAQQWESARVLGQAPGGESNDALLVLDEIQKLPGWSESVKRLWDEDTAAARPLHVVLLGSSPLLVQRGLTESLAGRFEVLPVTHWSLPEMRDAFGVSVEEFVYYGGYPGAAALFDEPQRWRQYLLDALIETSVSRDVLLMSRIDKPALLRRLFKLGCTYSGRILSYQKMVGQLQDAGNTTTLAHYLELLSGAATTCRD